MPKNIGIYSVYILNKIAKKILEEKIGMIWIEAELSNFSAPSSGHWYFTLKDEKAQIRAVMFKHKNIKVNFLPNNGQQLLIRAYISLYEIRGEYQLIVENIQPIGDGLLQQKFEILKQKLFSEGLFSSKNKKKLPKFINHLGIITSRTGAALYDILKILKRRNPSLPITIYPTIVQGKDAIESICNSIDLANNRKECDTLIIARGGGSLEDLLAFNTEKVAYSIFYSKIPIVSAIGHETDFTISDFVSDVRASTPSAAAEIVSKNYKDLISHILKQKQKIEMSVDFLISKKSYKLSQIKNMLNKQHPELKLIKMQKYLLQIQQKLLNFIQKILQKNKNRQNIEKQNLFISFPQMKIQNNHKRIISKEFFIKQAIITKINSYKEKLNSSKHTIETTNPLHIISKGYSITKNLSEKIIKNVKQINVNEIIKTRICDGIINSKIISIKKLNNKQH